MIRFALISLSFATFLASTDSARAQQPKAKTKDEPKVIALPKDVKDGLMKRYTFNDDTRLFPLGEMLKVISAQGKVKIEIDEKAFRAAGTRNIEQLRCPTVYVQDRRLDLLLSDVMEGVDAQPEIRMDTIVLVPRGTGKQITTLRQPPDDKHKAAVAAAKKALATKANFAAPNGLTVSELLSDAAKRYKLASAIDDTAFRAAGVNAFADKKLKAIKGETLETFLRESLKSVGAELLLDSYGVLKVVPRKGAEEAM